MRNTCVLALCILLLHASVRADDSPVPKFLQPGQDYLIRFAVQSPFQKTIRTPLDRESSGVPNRSTRKRTTTHTIDIFTVVSLAGGSWILVEHPRAIEDASKWNSKRRAMVSLTPQAVHALQSTEDGKIRLEAIRTQASAEIETSRTWVNIDHMLTIRKAPSDLSDYDQK